MAGGIETFRFPAPKDGIAPERVAVAATKVFGFPDMDHIPQPGRTPSVSSYLRGGEGKLGDVIIGRTPDLRVFKVKSPQGEEFAIEGRNLEPDPETTLKELAKEVLRREEAPQ